MSAPATIDAAVTQTSTGAAKKGGGSMLPVLLVVFLVPALCYGMTTFLLVPKLKGAAGGEVAAEHGGDDSHGATASDSHGGGHGGGHGKADASKSAHGGGSHGGKKGNPNEHTAEFGSTIVNLAGAMGSRYLRTNFVVASANPKVGDIVSANQNALKDVAITVLSSQSLSALENPGAKNLVRNELISQFNRTLGTDVIDQIYFSEFVVQ